MERHRILVINPGSTSTKIAVFEDEQPLFSETVRHDFNEITKFATVFDQFDFRKQIVLSLLQSRNFDLHTLSAVIGRGGMVKPVKSGVYGVNDLMMETLRDARYGNHASNLGALLAGDIAAELGIPSYMADPVVVDEFEELARVTGLPEITRKSTFHALNQKAMARKAAEQLGRRYEDINLIVVHLGGGISVGTHMHGRVVDVNNALDGDGPFSPDRTGTLPTEGFRRLVFKLGDEKAIMRRLVGGGGLVAHLGTNDTREVERRIQEGDEKALFYYEAMAYTIAKEIGASATVLKGDVQGIVLTGGIAHSKMMVGWLTERVSFIAPIIHLPGEFEMEALASSALRVLRGEENAKQYA